MQLISLCRSRVSNNRTFDIGPFDVITSETGTNGTHSATFQLSFPIGTFNSLYITSFSVHNKSYSKASYVQKLVNGTYTDLIRKANNSASAIIDTNYDVSDATGVKFVASATGAGQTVSWDACTLKV